MTENTKEGYDVIVIPYKVSSFDNVFKKLVSTAQLYVGIRNGANYDIRENPLLEEFNSYSYDYFLTSIFPFIKSETYSGDLEGRYNDFLLENNIGVRNIDIEVFYSGDFIASARANLSKFTLYNTKSNFDLRSLNTSSNNSPITVSDNYFEFDNIGLLERLIKDYLHEDDSFFKDGTNFLSLEFFYYLNLIDYFNSLNPNLSESDFKYQ
jgi:hypothetical protein